MDPPLWPFTAEERVEAGPGLLHDPMSLGREVVLALPGVGHLLAQARLDCAINGLGFGEAGGGIVEINHATMPRGSFRAPLPSDGWPSVTRERDRKLKRSPPPTVWRITPLRVRGSS